MMLNILTDPKEGAKGFAKGAVNIVPDTPEMIGQGANLFSVGT